MKTSTLVRNGVSPEMVEIISRLVALIPWPFRRQAMGDVTLAILDGKPRVAEKEFGWNRSSVTLGINEFRSGIICINDLSQRHKCQGTPTFTKLGDTNLYDFPWSQFIPFVFVTTLPLFSMAPVAGGK